MGNCGKKQKDKARKRAETIMKVRCGLMTATQAAKALGVSRKTYYKWEQRGLAALMDGLEDQVSGRPKRSGEIQKEADLAERIEELKRENKMLKQKMELKALLGKIEIRSASDRTKKK
jgi:transposase